MREQKTQIKPRLTANSLAVLRRRYLIRDDQGQVAETPEELFMRVATVIAAGAFLPIFLTS
ncbi:MAG: ribonucleotide reductase N-terminal alpha domain-containing protein [candidate division Zixibacteria bacterium]